MSNHNEATGLFHGGFLFIGVTLGAGIGFLSGHPIIGTLMGIGLGIGMGLIANGIVTLLKK